MHTNNVVIILSVFLISCSNNYPSYYEVNQKVKKSNKELLDKFKDDFKLKRCPDNCNEKLSSDFSRVSKYFNLKKDLYLINSDKYYAISLPSGDILTTSYTVNNLSSNQLSALFCHELSHSSYGHSYQKAFKQNVSKISDINYSISFQKGFGIGNAAIKAIEDKPKAFQFIVGTVFSLGGLVDDGVGFNDDKDAQKLYEYGNSGFYYFSGDVFPQEVEIQADNDAKRCLSSLGLKKHNLTTALYKMFLTEKNHLSQSNISKFNQRIKLIGE